MVFGVVKKALGISPLPDGAPHGYQVNLSAAVAWAAREARLQDPDKEDLDVNLKLDGRPFCGRFDNNFGSCIKIYRKTAQFFCPAFGYQIKASVTYLCRGSVSFISCL